MSSRLANDFSIEGWLVAGGMSVYQQYIAGIYIYLWKTPNENET